MMKVKDTFFQQLVLDSSIQKKFEKPTLKPVIIPVIRNRQPVKTVSQHELTSAYQAKQGRNDNR